MKENSFYNNHNMICGYVNALKYKWTKTSESDSLARHNYTVHSHKGWYENSKELLRYQILVQCQKRIMQPSNQRPQHTLLNMK